MGSCAFYGHRSFRYSEQKEKIETIIVGLIEKHDVTEFYNGFRGGFDMLCAEVVYELKSRYPMIKNILVLSYHPRAGFTLPTFLMSLSICLTNLFCPSLQAPIPINVLSIKLNLLFRALHFMVVGHGRLVIMRVVKKESYQYFRGLNKFQNIFFTMGRIKMQEKDPLNIHSTSHLAELLAFPMNDNDHKAIYFMV